MHGSDEEVDDPQELGSDDDFSEDGDKEILEEVLSGSTYKKCLLNMF